MAEQQGELKAFFKDHGTKILVVLVVIVAIVTGVTQYKEHAKAAAQAEAAVLGQGMTLVYSGNDAAALQELESQINSNSLKGLSLAKASLLAGNIKFRNKDYDGAGALFKVASANAGSADLILSAALHGEAAVSIEKKDYANAAKQLEAFISKFGKRTGDLKARYQKDEAADLAPTVADAYWKLALVYNALNQNDKAKATAEKLLKIYGDKPEVVSKANKFLASI